MKNKPNMSKLNVINRLLYLASVDLKINNNINGLYEFIEKFELFFSELLPSPYIYPSIDNEGGIIAEWDVGDFSISLDVNLQNMKANYEVANLIDVKFDQSYELDLNNSEDWNKLINDLFLKKTI